jgi:6-pyruvoyltetrahydropterin/6-carboxytetrahydropterin synthase
VKSTVRLTRVVSFSAGHRYWLNSLTAEENRQRFGKWASPYNHGHNYVLSVTAEGPVDVSTGMVVNIKRIDDLLKERILSQFDQRSINDEVPWFEHRASSLENILSYIRGELESLPEPAVMVGLKLEEMPTLWAEWNIEQETKMTITRVYEFAASHRLHAPQLPHERNLELYGKCNNPAGHGHNYVLEVSIAGVPDETTGFAVDLGRLDEVVHAEVVDRYDHHNLNEDLPEFKDRMTTSEVVVQEIWKRLDGKVPGELARIRLHETARNIFEVSR